MNIESVPIAKVMITNVKTAEEEQSVSSVAKLMSDNNIGSVIIMKNGEGRELSGIITERDIVHITGAIQTSSPLTLQLLLARHIMSKPVITICAESSIQDAIQSMKLNNIRRLPVVNREGMLVGIITDKDIFRAIINSQSLISSITESVSVELKPMYERLSEFMIGETVFPRGSSPN
jgi:CBS domain-containing protein